MNRLFSLSFVLLLFTACLDDDDTQMQVNNCGPEITITNQAPNSANTNFSLSDVNVDGLCLSLKLGASGCSMDNWTTTLQTDGSIAESLPTQSSATLVFDDGTPGGSACLAFFTDTYTFDLSPYLGQGALPTIFSIKNANDSILVQLTIEE